VTHVTHQHLHTRIHVSVTHQHLHTRIHVSVLREQKGDLNSIFTLQNYVTLSRNTLRHIAELRHTLYIAELRHTKSPTCDPRVTLNPRVTHPHLHARYKAAEDATPMTTTPSHTNTHPSTHAYHPLSCPPPTHKHPPIHPWLPHAQTQTPTHPSIHPALTRTLHSSRCSHTHDYHTPTHKHPTIHPCLPPTHHAVHPRTNTMPTTQTPTPTPTRIHVFTHPSIHPPTHTHTRARAHRVHGRRWTHTCVRVC